LPELQVAFIGRSLTTVLARQNDVDIQGLQDTFKERRAEVSTLPREDRLGALQALATEILSVVDFDTLELDGIAEALNGFTLQYGPSEWMETMLKRLVAIAADEEVSSFDRAVASALGASLRLPGTYFGEPAGPRG